MKRAIFLLLLVTVLLWLAGATFVSPVRASQSFAQANHIRLTYTISYSDARTPPLITLNIRGVPKGGVDLIVSPMTSFDMDRQEDAFTWIVDEVQATTPEGKALPIEKRGIISSYFSLVPINPHYRLYHLDTQGYSDVLIRYRAKVPIVVGYLETLLLRPIHHEEIGHAELHFDLPQGWKAATVVSPRDGEPATFDLQRLNTMYGDNLDPALNYVPMAFAVGEQNDIVEVRTDCGRLVFSYPRDYSPSFGDREKELGRKMFEFMCHAVGPLEPYRVFIANNKWQQSWMPNSYQPGLYTYFWQHNRTMDWSTGVPTFTFSPWRLGTLRVGNTVVDEPDVTYYHFPHALSRAWFRGSTYFVLRWQQPDILVRGGFSGYLQERMLYCAFGPLKVYRRWQATYEYYKKNYVGTTKDRPLAMGGDHFIGYFKSELWAFYANQKILEATGGQRDLTDAVRWLYEKFGGTGRAYGYSDVRKAINIAANADLGYLFDDYWYTAKPLPLDGYFADDDQDGVPNGLEQELGLSADRVDTDGDGINDLEEIEKISAMDPSLLCMHGRKAFALMGQAALTATPTPTPMSRPTGTPTATPLPSVAPSSMPSSIPLEGALIRADGMSDDWPEIGPFKTDPEEPGIADDITAFYALEDAKYLYLRLDGRFSSSPPAQFTFDMWLKPFSGESRRIQVSTETSAPTTLHVIPLNSKGQPTFDKQVMYAGCAFSTTTYEAVIPWKILRGHPKELVIRPYVVGQGHIIEDLSQVDIAYFLTPTVSSAFALTPTPMPRSTSTFVAVFTPTVTPFSTPVSANQSALPRWWYIGLFLVMAIIGGWYWLRNKHV